MNAPDLLARLGEWCAVADLADDGRVVVCECTDPHVPPELLEACREHKQELAAWLTWERDAAALWRALFDRLSDRADLAGDPDFQALVAVADAAHLRHDRAMLADALLDLEALARDCAA